MKLLITLLTPLILCFFSLQRESFGQSQFQVSIGGSNNEFANSMTQAADGGYVLAGYTESFGAGYYDFYIVKLNSSGILQWSRTVGGDSNDVANSIIKTSDGGFAVAGYTHSFGSGGPDVFVVKLDGSGAVQWTKAIGGTGDERAYSIVQSSDGGYLAAGYTLSFGAGSYDMYIVKLDPDGEYQWSKTIGSAAGDVGTSIINTTDGGYALAGYSGTTTTNSIDYNIVKLNSDGTVQWCTSVGGTAHDYAWGIAQATDGGYAVTGYCQGFGAGNSDLYIVKLNSGGSVQWTRTVGGAGSDMGRSILQIADGSYIAAGSTNSFGGADIYIVKLSSSGSLQWSKTAGGTNNDYAQNIMTTNDGGYAIGGTSNTISGGWYTLSEMYLVKFDGNWKTCNYKTQKSQSGTGGTPSSQTIIVNSPSSLATASTPASGNGGTVTALCSSHNGPLAKNESVENTQLPLKFGLEQNYPNPFNPSTKIKYQIGYTQSESQKVTLAIYSNLGEQIAVLVNEQQTSGLHEVEWDASNLPSGIYYYELKSGNFSETKRMVLVK